MVLLKNLSGREVSNPTITMAGAGAEVNGAPVPFRGQPRAEGPACVLGIGTAVPPAEFLQSEYPDFFFNITNCGDKEALKAKFKRICESSPPSDYHFSSLTTSCISASNLSGV